MAYTPEMFAFKGATLVVRIDGDKRAVSATIEGAASMAAHPAVAGNSHPIEVDVASIPLSPANIDKIAAHVLAAVAKRWNKCTAENRVAAKL